MNRKSMTLVTGLLLAIGTHPAWAQYSDKTDHRLVSRYEGSTVTRKEAEEFARYQLVTSWDKQGFHGPTLEGTLTRIVYGNPQGRSTLEIFRNYQKALVGAGFQELWSCELNECGPSYARSAWNRHNGLFAASDGDPRYLAARLDTDQGTAYVALMVGIRRSQLDIIEIKGMDDDRVTVDADAMASGLDRDGKIAVYGIYFDVDKTDIKAESRAALQEIAQLLRKRPHLTVYIVGHTDMTGSLSHNMQLSEGRARAVVKTLIRDYKVASSRLEGHGVGPLSPVASNTDEKGRAKNRRVELVAR